MWKLGWFLRDFLDDPELLSQDEVDERALHGLVGVVKISHTCDRRQLFVPLDGNYFSPSTTFTAITSQRHL